MQKNIWPQLKMLLALLLTLVVITPARAQEFCLPTIKFEALNWQDFVPQGWHIINHVSGDMNEDKAPDHAVVIEYKEVVRYMGADNKITEAKPRLLFLVTQAKPRKFYRLVEQSNHFILPMPAKATIDPFKGMRYERGLLFFDFVLLNELSNEYSVQCTYTFKFQLARFYLFGAKYHSAHQRSQNYADYTFNFPNGNVGIRKGTLDEGDIIVQSRQLRRMMLKHFGSFTAPFTWEVLPGLKI